MTQKQALNDARKYVEIISVEGVDEYRPKHQAWGFRAYIRSKGKTRLISNCVSNNSGSRWRSNTEFVTRCKNFSQAAASALGSIHTPKKAASSRENGRRGGRPAGVNVTMIDGEIIRATIKNAPARIEREYGFKKMAHWLDKDTKAPCSTPVVKDANGYKEIL